MHVKLAIARRQLGTGLALFIADEDPVSVHCLACGGGELAYHLARAAGGSPWIDEILNANPAARIRDLMGMRNRFWNAMKHATLRDGKLRPDEELLIRFDDSENDELLFLGWFDYAQAAGSLPIEAHIYQRWFLARYPHVLGDDELQPTFDKIFPNIVAASRSEAKRKLRRFIERQRVDKATMNQKMIDRRKLIMNRLSHPLHSDRSANWLKYDGETSH